MKDNREKPLMLSNISTENVTYDSLNAKATSKSLCTPNICKGSQMIPSRANNKPRPKEDMLQLAKEFFDEYYQSMKKFQNNQHTLRWNEVSQAIKEKGSYDLTEAELSYGAKIAWRNAPRCIGRIQWSKLQMFDARKVTTATEMFETILKHMRYATNKGNIRSAITIFPPRTDCKHDFKVWNSQLISYAGYRNSDGTITGDPINVEFTEICQKLGWRGPGKKWDILPLVLSADGQDPEWFDLPQEEVLEVKFSHPEFKWFADFNFQWYCLPAVANMLFDCGGLQFPAAPFNGWYMASEIATRNLCDSHRWNVLEQVGQAMGLNTNNNANLWKDKALVEINIAVLHSFQQRNITIVDHHTASETFVKHLENEQRLRGGCPADWVWIVPPISGSITPVFHQEMSLYYLKPSYEYQKPAWKTHIWKEHNRLISGKKNRRKYTFKEVAWVVMFTSNMYRKALSRRIKATILYASETGKSEKFARKLREIFEHAFNVQIYCMSDYDVTSMNREALLLIVTSTFGNGDPPENGENFEMNLHGMKAGSSHNFFDGKFAVFALGSRAYPNFCAFGKHTDEMLEQLGGERLMPVTCADELAGQEQNFKSWAPQVFRVGCKTFALDNEDLMMNIVSTLQSKSQLTPNQLKLIMVAKATDLASGLSRLHGKKLMTCKVKSAQKLHGGNASHWTHQVIIDTGGAHELMFQPGDHIEIFPVNRKELVDEFLQKIKNLKNPDMPVQLMILKETRTVNGSVNCWEPDERLPKASVRTLLTRYLDITTPPTPKFLLMLEEHAMDNKYKTKLQQLAKDPEKYEKWKTWTYPHLPEVLGEFPSVQVPLGFLLSQLPTLKSRFYSISSSPQVHKNEIHLTVAVVLYNTKGGDGPVHYGVSSNYLKEIQPGDEIICHTRKTNGFHLPNDPKAPIILVGPGTGIAPFRSFWQHRCYNMNNKQDDVGGEMTLFFGSRTRMLDLYKDEKEEMVQLGVLKRSYVALSREPNVPKTYVQDLIMKEANDVYKTIINESGHVYVCGDCTMAECVYQKLKLILKTQGQMTDQDVDNYMIKMKGENRYHEDIFGIIPRTGTEKKSTNKIISKTQKMVQLF